MTYAMLRRPKLGKTSCREIVNFSNKIDSVLRNDQPFPPDFTMVFRWGTTSNVPCNNIVNTAEAIHRVNDKTGFRRILMNHHFEGHPLLCPHTYFEEGVPHNALPLVVRPRTHAQGRNLYVARTGPELSRAALSCGDGWYASKLIDKAAEYRVAFVQGRVAWVAQKTPGNPEDIAWNVARGGRFDNVRWDNWPLKTVRVAREAFMLSGLHFGGVDVMVDHGGEAFVLEINSAPSLTSPYRQECMAKCFDYLIEHGKENLPVIQERGGWKKFIHPALYNEALL